MLDAGRSLVCNRHASSRARMASISATLARRIMQSGALIPAVWRIHDFHDHQYHRHLDQHTNHRGQRSVRFETEQADGRRDRQFEEIGGADQ